MIDGVLEAALGDLFADPNIATTIVWHSVGGGAALNVRAILRRPDLVTGFGDSRVAATTMVVEVFWRSRRSTSYAVRTSD